METSIESAIEEIIKGVPPYCVFDSHFVISELIKKSSDRYLAFAGKAAPGSRKPTLPTHGQIGRKINKLGGRVIEKIKYKSWSRNVHGRASQCTCWLKKSARKTGGSVYPAA